MTDVTIAPGTNGQGIAGVHFGPGERVPIRTRRDLTVQRFGENVPPLGRPHTSCASGSEESRFYLTWGSVSPLTTRGTHDFIRIFCAYIFAGTFAYMLARRLGPGRGVFKPHPGYWIPDLGYFGISMTTSGLGVVFNNVFIAYAVGGVVGGLIAYHTKNVIHALLGPLAGYVAGNASLTLSRRGRWR